MKTYGKLGIIALTVIFALSMLGCSMAPALGKPIVTIGAPAHGAQLNVGQEVLVQAMAADNTGISRVELWVDGQLLMASQPPAPQSSHAAVLRWTPAAAGAHLLLVKAVNLGNVASDPAAIAVNAVASNASAAAGSAANPTAQPAAAPTLAPTPVPACSSDLALVEHLTVPDGTNWMPGQPFNKIWRVRNTGTCAWASGTELVFVGGEAMTGTSGFIVPSTAPGATADLLIAMVAPATPGTHTGQWRLRDIKTGLFGATLNASINVLGPVETQPQPAAQGNQSCLPPTIASFDAIMPLMLVYGHQPATLVWGKVDNVTSAVIDQGIGGVATPGQVGVDPKQTTTYTLTANGCGGTVSKQVTITVNPVQGSLQKADPIVGNKIDLSKMDWGSLQPAQTLQKAIPVTGESITQKMLQNLTAVEMINKAVVKPTPNGK